MRHIRHLWRLLLPKILLLFLCLSILSFKFLTFKSEQYGKAHLIKIIIRLIFLIFFIVHRRKQDEKEQKILKISSTSFLEKFFDPSVETFCGMPYGDGPGR